ncbi:glycoside hydrolase family 5 protein [Suhomyces tanzawaensis NRRL Y-17324]|uniref:Glycoside hydrolase family 5 protein n=1 Tax=Suhomyces tanzawaensis NRRL Y-17324 TaxID=984487 RepID=A0A1E4SBH5_9ASCO|nr:glycoside hydrolase family 5 protein [Suhomyces tanzawaensis NRRL Y-17324]ODV76851.1 glycoside hydrolase family 5 protein [Suhomyces tanzawaensis NRRL Y-17324]
MSGFLKTKGTKIVDANDQPVVLVGTAIGGHLNMENFITGYPGTETLHKKRLVEMIGQEKVDYFFDKFYQYFWEDEDAKFFKNELGLNCLRIPFNYHHFLDDDSDLYTINPKGFERLDRIVDICTQNEIYTVLDLHTAPGGQNQDWHCDSGINKSLLFDFKVFQDAVINLWVQIAKHYKDNTWVAGYNPLNEPSVEDHSRLVGFYKRLASEVRKVDPNHMFFLDGNTYAMDFRQFPKADEYIPNTVYSIHDYSNYGFPNLEGTLYEGTPEEKAELKHQYERKIQYMVDNGVPVWNGEFGPVYASEVRGDKNPDVINRARYNVLRDQLAVYKEGDPSGDKSPISWSIWLYKDIGFQGMTYVSPESKWFQVFGKWFHKKKHLGLDRWGNDIDPEFDRLYQELTDHMKNHIPEQYQKMYPPVWTIKDHLTVAAKDLLFSQYAQFEYADLFVGLELEDLDELAASFKFENVCKRDELNAILKDYKESR